MSSALIGRGCVLVIGADHFLTQEQCMHGQQEEDGCQMGHGLS